jgi:hypothetical protein
MSLVRLACVLASPVPNGIELSQTAVQRFDLTHQIAGKSSNFTVGSPPMNWTCVTSSCAASSMTKFPHWLGHATTSSVWGAFSVAVNAIQITLTGNF